MSITAKVFKTETFGAVDGPGVRLVIFLQGCSFRCIYCHNPESWNMTSLQARSLSINDIIELYERNKEFYEKGGITLSGGEPMLQAEFIKELGKVCQQKHIHLAIDTSACNFAQNKADYEQLLDLVNLWIIDLKALDPQLHKKITGSDYLAGVELTKFLEEKNKPFWLRQVIIQGINNDKKHIDELVSFIKPLKNCQKAEILSFHNLATDKYKKLGIEYPCKDIQMLTTPDFEQLKDYLNKQISK